jgi:hypothetical protein
MKRRRRDEVSSFIAATRLEPATRATCRPTRNLWQERYVLVDGRRELGCSEPGAGSNTGAGPPNAGAALEPGLLLFAAFVVRGLAEYAVQ